MAGFERSEWERIDESWLYMLGTECFERSEWEGIDESWLYMLGTEWLHADGRA